MGILLADRFIMSTTFQSQETEYFWQCIKFKSGTINEESRPRKDPGVELDSELRVVVVCRSDKANVFGFFPPHLG